MPMFGPEEIGQSLENRGDLSDLDLLVEGTLKEIKGLQPVFTRIRPFAMDGELRTPSEVFEGYESTVIIEALKPDFETALTEVKYRGIILQDSLGNVVQVYVQSHGVDRKKPVVYDTKLKRWYK
jgi:hypothetical protein